MSNRIVKLPSVESFGRLTPDKWLALKNLEESADDWRSLPDKPCIRHRQSG